MCRRLEAMLIHDQCLLGPWCQRPFGACASSLALCYRGPRRKLAIVPPKKQAPHGTSSEPWPEMRPLALAVSRSTFQRRGKMNVELAQRWLRGDLRVPTCFPFLVKRGKSTFLLKF